MSNRLWQSILLIMAVGLSTGCNVSLQSTQYSFVKNLLEPVPEVAEKTWKVSWDGRDHDVYAVNHKDGIYFANESGLLVDFDGFQVTRLSLPGNPSKKVAKIAKVVNDGASMELQFQDGSGRTVGRHLCSFWQSFNAAGVVKGWNQECSDGITMYTNEIRVNEQNQIVALKQVLVPSIAAIVVAQRR